MERIKQRRKELKISQKELADAIGCHVQSVKNWENGNDLQNCITSDRLIKLAEVLQCSTDYLLGLDTMPDTKSSFTTESIGFSEDAAQRISGSDPADLAILSDLIACEYYPEFIQNIRLAITAGMNWAAANNQDQRFHAYTEYRIMLQDSSETAKKAVEQIVTDVIREHRK